MEFEEDNSKQPQQFDKIFRENMNNAFNSIGIQLLKLDIASIEELPDSIQHTKERRPDVLKKITDSSGASYILHLEYQTTNDREIAFRMADYSIMLQKKYRMKVKQYVIFIGSVRLNMPVSIVNEDFQFKYNLLSFSDISYKKFLDYSKPEEILLAILCNFEEDDSQTAVNRIVSKIENVNLEGLDKQRYFNQLRILVKLRNLQPEFNIAMEPMSKIFREKDDLFYQRGQIHGKLEGKLEGRLEGKLEGESKAYLNVAQEMKKKDMPIELIAEITKLPIEEIERLGKA